MVTRKQIFETAMAVTSFGTLAGSAQAALINPSFETGDLTGWTLASSGGYGSGASVSVAAPATFGPPLPGTAEGTYYASLAGNGGKFSFLYQDVGPLAPNTTYVLTVAIGVGHYDYPTKGSIALINGTDQSGASLANADPASLGFAPFANNFKDLSTTFTTGSAVTGDLVIAIGGDGYPESSLRLDNIRLSTDGVPEPGTISLLGLATMSALRLRRRIR